MPLTVVDAYGAPSYGAIGMAPQGMCFHSPENADITLASAIQVATWQASSGNTSGGSYHGILGFDSNRGTMDNPEAWVMVRSVPWNLAAGGLSSDHGSWHWNPDRYPWIRQMLSTTAFNDPNRWLHQIAISGKALWYVQNGYPKGVLIRIAEWVRTLELAYGYDALLTLHRHWQTDRSDPGPLDFCDRVLVEYNRLYYPPIPVLTPEQRIEKKNAYFDSSGVAVRNLERRLGGAQAALIEAIRVELRAGRAV